ncbi:CIA30 family protein [Shewanella khirikhana]|uniref:Complex I intermediate-associated protein 30 (CIA30) n=1 Tax=Shewanella khirikhana TaxID=1965282 RepID=A0ABM7DNQ5_9GAMM|nr:CIA30 family protein [Shewanella khirikhana]AZQ11038.1 Complex I intermediate-associated protein 30 (CIA30) [Shewanella khirikhana]
MRLVDFTALDSTRDWYSVTDSLMGGQSRAQLLTSPKGHGLFTGLVSLANGGGFASVYLDFEPKDVSAYLGVELEIEAPQRLFKVNLKDVACGDRHVYQATLGEVHSEQRHWRRYRIPFNHFVAMRRGLTAMAPPLDRFQVCGFGLVAGDGVEGEFSLAIRSISFYKH